MTSNLKAGDDHDVPSSENASASLSLEDLGKYLAEKLHIGKSADDNKKEKETVLENVSVDGIVNFMKSEKCRNIITLAGAGISTAAGIPDFRSPNSGLYDNLHKYKLPHPQAIFELDFFQRNPKPFFVLAKELYPGTFKPTAAHYFLRLLERKGLLLRHYTQNIDTLERIAGLPDDKLVEAHGTFFTGHCMACKQLYTLPWMKERIFADEIPVCESCPGVVKPDIVFFGESLPGNFERCIETDFDQCDLLIILGSSLVVQPFASLVDRVPDSCPRLLINREKVGQSSGIMALLGFGGGLNFDNPDNTRDVAWLGDCDDGCQLLAEKLNWKDELNQLIQSEHQRIDEENQKEKDSRNIKTASKKEDSKKLELQDLKKPQSQKDSKKPKSQKDSKKPESQDSKKPESSKKKNLHKST